MSTQSRHVYTREQRAILEASFAHQSHPDINEKERLTKLLNCNLIQISNWFQNHRRRVKKQNKSTVSHTSTTMNTPPVNPTSFVYHQPDCPFINNHDNSSYYYYSSPPQYVYSPEPMYIQPMLFNSFLTYE